MGANVDLRKTRKYLEHSCALVGPATLLVFSSAFISRKLYDCSTKRTPVELHYAFLHASVLLLYLWISFSSRTN